MGSVTKKNKKIKKNWGGNEKKLKKWNSPVACLLLESANFVCVGCSWGYAVGLHGTKKCAEATLIDGLANFLEGG